MTLKYKLTVIGVILFVSLVSDQVTKQIAIATLKDSSPVTYFFGIVKFVYAENTGAFGSLGSDWSEVPRWIFLKVLPLVALVGILIYIIRNQLIPRFELIALALIVGGGLGNMIDRFLFGYVVDFLYIGYGPVGTNIFNIADVLIVIGGCMLIIFSFIQPKKEEEAKKETKA